MIPFYYIKAGSFSHTADHRLENVPDAFKQMGNNPVIVAATVGKLSSFMRMGNNQKVVAATVRYKLYLFNPSPAEPGSALFDSS